MPASQLWAVLFFFMLVCLSLNSQVSTHNTLENGIIVNNVTSSMENRRRRNSENTKYFLKLFILEIVTFHNV